jgi:membrane-associated phospholipid phosphatase
MGREYPQKKWLFWLAAGLIFFATFLIKQHFIMDAISGLILGLIGLYLWDKQTQRVA